MPVFHYLHLRTFSHETEDPGRVRVALRNVAGVDKLDVDETKVEGSHGNRILILEAQVKSASAERALFEALARDDPRGFARVVEETDRRVDEHLNFFLRVEKQDAFEGRLVVATSDDAVTVRGKLRTHPSGADPRARAVAELRTFLGRSGIPKA